MQYRPGVEMWLYIYTYRQGWVGEKDCNAMKETLKETNRLKSNRSANSSIYALLKGHSLLLLVRNGYVAIAPNPCTETTPKLVMRICHMRNH